MWQLVAALPQAVNYTHGNTSQLHQSPPLKYIQPLLSNIENFCGSADGQMRSVRQRLRNLCSRIKKLPAITWPKVMALCYETCQSHPALASIQLSMSGDRFQWVGGAEGNSTVPFYHHHRRSMCAMALVTDESTLKRNNAATRILQLLTNNDDVWALYSDGWLHCWRDVSIHRQAEDQYTMAEGKQGQWPSPSDSQAMHDAWARNDRRVRLSVNCFNGYPSHAINKILYSPGYHDRGAWLSLAHTNFGDGGGGDMIAINTTAYDDRLWLYSCATGKLVHCVRLQLPQISSARGRTRVQTSKKIRVVDMQFICSSGLVLCALAGLDRAMTALGLPQIAFFDVQTGRMQGQLEAQVRVFLMQPNTNGSPHTHHFPCFL